VQGIREVDFRVGSSLPSSDGERRSDSGTYLNRADDGFVYFDCGSYSRGPVEMRIDEEVEVGCVAFGTMPKMRVVFDRSSASWQVQVRSLASRMSSGEYQNVPIFSKNEDGGDTLMALNIKWGKDTVCRMPSADQPWMLQRVKWQKSYVDGVHVIDDEKKVDPHELEAKGWIRTWNEADGEIARASWGSSSLDDFILVRTSQIIQFGAACLTTGEVKGIIRCYDEKRALKGVILQQGVLESK